MIKTEEQENDGNHNEQSPDTMTKNIPTETHFNSPC